MAVSLVNGLFPPQVATFQPAFIYNTAPTVSFSISPYNSHDQISYLHVSVVDQRNNENVLLGLLDNEYWNVDNNYGYGLINGILVIAFPPDPDHIYDGHLIQYDREKNLYTVVIPPRLLRQESTVKKATESGTPIDTKYFNVGQYYKVQLRFDSSGENLRNLITNSSQDNENGKDNFKQFINYMIDKREYFSEWSEVSLIKPIFHVNFQFPLLDGSTLENTKTLNKGLCPISAKVFICDQLYFQDKDRAVNSDLYKNIDGLTNEDEHLERYKITVHPLNQNGEPDKTITIAETKWIYATPVEVNGTSEYGVNTSIDLDNTTAGEKYALVLNYYTNNNYSGSVTKEFEISYEFDAFNPPRWHERTDPQYTTADERDHLEVNQEDGYVKIRFRWSNAPVTVDGETYSLPPGFLYIRRASSIDNFKSWKLIGVTSHTEESISKNSGVTFDFDDYTVCSLNRYQYSAQYRMLKSPTRKNTTNVSLAAWTKTYKSEVVYIKFYEMLLQRKNRQIAIRYNGQVTSWKPMVNRQKVDTLGGKYPKFVENAQMNYKQFSINGLISAEEDFNRKFLSEFDGKFVLDPVGDYWLLDDGTYTKDVPADAESKNYSRYSYVYIYTNDIEAYNKVFDGKYMVRNDTDPDGEYGWNPDLKKNEYKNADGTYRQGGIIPDAADSADGYDKSVFGSSSNNAVEWIKYYQHDMYPTNNWYWERVFREELTSWLNDGEPKLYRSMPEGNLAVMLTDINLTPNAQLGRRLYSFSATLYEIGDGYDLDKLEEMGIIDIPKLTTAYGETTTSAELAVEGMTTDDDDDSENGIFNSTVQEVGQLWLPRIYDHSLVSGQSNQNIVKSIYDWDTFTIAERLQSQYSGVLSHYNIAIERITLPWVRVQFSSPSKYYVAKGEGDGEDKKIIWSAVKQTWTENEKELGEQTIPETVLQSVTKTDFKYNLVNSEVNKKEKTTRIIDKVYKEEPAKDKNWITDSIQREEATLALGHLIDLDYQPVFINDRGFYQTPEGTSISQIQLYDAEFIGDHYDDVVIDYIINYKRSINSSNIPTKTTKVEKIVGQIGDIYPYETSIRDRIQEKYYFVKYDTPTSQNGYRWMTDIAVEKYDDNYDNGDVYSIDEDGNKTLRGHKISNSTGTYYVSVDSNRSSRYYQTMDELHMDDIAWNEADKLPVKYTQYLNTWQGVSVDVTPYTVMKVTYPDIDNPQTILVGRTGVLSFFDDTPVTQIQFCGRRMVQVPWERQPYLDEWEFVLCDSLRIQEDINGTDFYNLWNNLTPLAQAEVLFYFGYENSKENVQAWMEQYTVDGKFNLPEDAKRVFYPYWFKMFYSSVLDIEKPTYNTVYPIGINGRTYYYIYYIDGNFYEVETNVTWDSTGEGDKTVIADLSQGTIVAKVPVYGYVNYTGEILRSEL